jgi:hypothetical protein
MPEHVRALSAFWAYSAGFFTTRLSSSAREAVGLPPVVAVEPQRRNDAHWPGEGGEP